MEPTSLIADAPFLSSSPVSSETLMGVIKASLPEQVLISFYTALNEEGFWEVLGQKIYGPGTSHLLLHHRLLSSHGRIGKQKTEADSSFEYASAFFNRLVDQCATQTNADVLFSHLIHDTRFLDGLVDSISNSPIYEQKVGPFASKLLLLIGLLIRWSGCGN